MRRTIAATLLPLALTLVACSGAAMSGTYLVAPGYGFEFDGESVYSMTGNQTARGTYTRDGSAVRICFGFLCNDMELHGDCLVEKDGARYCKA